MRKLKLFLASRKGQIMFNLIYSWGAAIVILGAMGKIMHLGGFWDYMLTAGLVVEAFVFLAAGFDYSSAAPVNDSEAGAAGSGVIIGGVSSGSVVSSGDNKVAAATTGKASSGGSGSVVVVSGGGGTGSGSVQPGIPGSGANISSGGVSQGGAINSGPVVVGSSGGGVKGQTVVSGNANVSGTGSVAPEYAESLTNTAQNLDEFSNTVHSLNQVSQTLLDAYKNITETNGFVDNLTTLNQNVSGLNEVFNSQLQTITEQMAAIRYINDSLQRMKNLYDGAIGDSYMFREESAKMTKHIEALNNVYARLLQAMTTNNNNNMNQNNF